MVPVMYGNKKCMKCGKGASHKFTRIEKGQIYDIYLCAEHAAELSPYQKPKIPLSDILEGLLKQEAETPAGGGSGTSAPPDLRCDHCGLSFSNYRKSLLLGCGRCYDSFHDYLIPDLRRFHGDTHHRGRKPGGGRAEPAPTPPEPPVFFGAEEAAGKIAEIPEPVQATPAEPKPPTREEEMDSLKRALKRAIAQENFKRAAELRDKIREMNQASESDTSGS